MKPVQKPVDPKPHSTVIPDLATLFADNNAFYDEKVIMEGFLLTFF